MATGGLMVAVTMSWQCTGLREEEEFRLSVGSRNSESSLSLWPWVSAESATRGRWRKG